MKKEHFKTLSLLLGAIFLQAAASEVVAQDGFSAPTYGGERRRDGGRSENSRIPEKISGDWMALSGPELIHPSDFVIRHSPIPIRDIRVIRGSEISASAN